MSQKIEVSRIDVKVNGKHIELSLEEARQLRDILLETFPKKEQPTINIGVVKEYVPMPQPIYIPTYPERRYGKWEVTCQSNRENSGTLCLSTNHV